MFLSLPPSLVRDDTALLMTQRPLQ